MLSALPPWEARYGTLRRQRWWTRFLFTQLDSGEPVSNIVLMGIGEPLDNMDTVLKFLTLVNQPNGLNIGHAPHLPVYLRAGGSN